MSLKVHLQNLVISNQVELLWQADDSEIVLPLSFIDGVCLLPHPHHCYVVNICLEPLGEQYCQLGAA
jgi:hypothetical protein